MLSKLFLTLSFAVSVALPSAYGEVDCATSLTIQQALPKLVGPTPELFQEAFEGIPLAMAAETLYGQDGLDILRRLQLMNLDFAAFIFHPGVIYRLSQFERFVAKNRLATTVPNAVIRKFQEMLGAQVIYRAMALTEAEHARVLKYGLISKLARQVRRVSRDEGRQLITSQLQRQVTKGLRERVVFSDGNLDPYLSFTGIPEIGTAVAKDYLTANRQMYVYTVEVSVLDLIYLKNQRGRLFTQAQVSRNLKIRALAQGGRIVATLPFDDPRVESFVFYQVPPEKIFAYKQVPKEDFGFIDWEFDEAS